MKPTVLMLREKFETIRFFFKLHGLKKGFIFLFNLIHCGREKIYSLDLKGGLSDRSEVTNSKLNLYYITTLDQYDRIFSDYASAIGEALSAQDRKKIVFKKEALAVMYNEGQFVGWGWVKFGPLKFGNCHLRESDCMIHRCRTLPQYRRRRIYTTLLIGLQNILKKEGFHRVYISAKSFNKISLKGIEKAGFEFVQEYDPGSFWSRLLHHLKGKDPKIMGVEKRKNC